VHEAEGGREHALVEPVVEREPISKRKGGRKPAVVEPIAVVEHTAMVEPTTMGEEGREPATMVEHTTVGYRGREPTMVDEERGSCGMCIEGLCVVRVREARGEAAMERKS
jgi:hypothetical protein